MSNFNHSFLSWRGKDPDKDEENIRIATAWTVDFLESAKSAVSNCAWDRLLTITGRTRSTDFGFEHGMQVVAPLKDLFEYQFVLRSRHPSADRFVAWGRERTYPPFKAAFLSSLQPDDALAWLLEGEWTGSSGDGKSVVATLEKSGSGFLYRVNGGKRVWQLRRDGTALSGESMMGAEFLRSQRVPEMILLKGATVSERLSHVEVFRIDVRDQRGCTARPRVVAA